MSGHKSKMATMSLHGKISKPQEQIDKLHWNLVCSFGIKADLNLFLW